MIISSCCGLAFAPSSASFGTKRESILLAVNFNRLLLQQTCAMVSGVLLYNVEDPQGLQTCFEVLSGTSYSVNDVKLTACSTSRNTGTRNTRTRNTGTSRNIPEHPKNPEQPPKTRNTPQKTRNTPKNPKSQNQMARQYVTALVSFSKLPPLIAHKLI